MTIRLKIFVLSLALLTLFCAALFVSIRLQENLHEEIGTITEHQVPINAIVSDIDSSIFKYSFTLSLLIHEQTPSDEVIAKYEAREKDVISTIQRDLEQLDHLIALAISDTRSDPDDRLLLARMAGDMTVLRRSLTPFEGVGLQIISAIRQRDAAAARSLIAQFEQLTQSLATDEDNIRQGVTAMMRSSINETLGQQGGIEKLSLGLFLVAALVGLGMAFLVARQMVAGLLQLVAGARAVQEGTFSEPLPVTSKDEVGQLTSAFNHMVKEMRSKDRIKDTFGKYVDPKIVAGLIDNETAEIAGAERRNVSVFFSDIQGFSSLSEQLTASAIANLLNHYFTVATEAIRAHNGVFDKYIGDAVMAFWTPPFSTGDSHAADACLAALAQQAAFVGIREDLPNILGLRRNVPDLIVRMGIATGEVVLGTIGADEAKSYTVIGDVVNLASRLEGVNKIYGTQILVAEETYRLAQNAVEGRELDQIVVAGKTEPVRIFEIMAPEGGLSPAREELRGHYARGLSLYRQRDWQGAEEAFAAALSAVPEDGPSRLFIERIAKLRAAPLTDDWDGIWRATEK